MFTVTAHAHAIFKCAVCILFILTSLSVILHFLSFVLILNIYCELYIDFSDVRIEFAATLTCPLHFINDQQIHCVCSCYCQQFWMKMCTRWHMLTQLWQDCLRYHWPENWRKYYSQQCVPRPLWCLTQMESEHWWKSPRVMVIWMTKWWPLTPLRFTPNCE